MSLAPDTFGNSPAALILVELLNSLNDSRQTRSVSRFLIAQNTIARELRLMPNKEVKATLIRLWKREIQDIVLTDLDPKVFTFTKNVAMAKARVVAETLKNT